MPSSPIGLTVRKAGRNAVTPSSILYAERNVGSASSKIVGPAAWRQPTSPEVAQMTSIQDRVDALRIDPSPAAMFRAAPPIAASTQSLEEKLFDATARAKILTSRVSMHLDQTWRARLFQQLDALHDPDEWEADDAPLQEASFATFLKALFLIRPSVRPGLGISSNGFLIAAWTVGTNRLTIEFLPQDRVKWVVSRYIEDEFEQFSGNTNVSRLIEGLVPHSPREWFDK